MEGKACENSEMFKWPRRGDEAVEDVGDGGPNDDGATNA